MSYAFRRLRRTLICIRRMFPRFLHCKMPSENPSLRIGMLLLGLSLLFFIGHVFLKQSEYEVRSHIFCFKSKTESMADINLDPPMPDKSIFFVDTSCISHLKNKIYLPARQVCVVEAAAMLHPEWSVYVLFGSPGVFKYDGRSKSDKVMKVLLNYDNIKLHHIDYNSFLEETPLEKFAKAKVPFDSPNSQFQANHILRTAALWKYGGLAVDMNMLLLKNIETLNRNFVGAEHEGYGNDIMRISSKHAGKRILIPIIEQMRNGYVPDIWNSLGSKAVTKAIESQCISINNRPLKNCGFLKIYSKKTFYPSEMVDWLEFFQEGDYTMLQVTNGSYAMRNWNIHTAKNVTNSMAYGIIARRVCPRAYAVSRGVFG